ncbi:MAG: hypothetical protein M3R17_10835 [Bacteroidota bacterium]|nr:hypothetical protein [Bacteroidota bacterium]
MNYESQLTPTPENNRQMWKVVMTQLLIFGSYQTALALMFRGDNSLSFPLTDMFFLIVHWMVLLIAMIVYFSNKERKKAIGYLISFLIIAIVGFGSCGMLA